ncbi:MAG: hypothetical protein WCV79_01650 [Candidatus Paceibacterota bacterium]
MNKFMKETNTKSDHSLPVGASRVFVAHFKMGEQILPDVPNI